MNFRRQNTDFAGVRGDALAIRAWFFLFIGHRQTRLLPCPSASSYPGGQLFLPSEKKELFKAFTQVASDLRAEYVLFYTPDNQEHTGKRRLIKVKLVDASGHLYHKQGYTY